MFELAFSGMVVFAILYFSLKGERDSLTRDLDEARKEISKLEKQIRSTWEEGHLEQSLTGDGNLQTAREAWYRGEYESARWAYWKSANHLSGTRKDEGQSRALGRELARFLHEDEAAFSILEEVVDLLSEQSSLRQKALLKDSRDDVKIILDLAEMAGHITRETKGRERFIRIGTVPLIGSDHHSAPFQSC